MKTNVLIAIAGLLVAAVAAYFAFDIGKRTGRDEARADLREFFQDSERFPGAAQAAGGGLRQGAAGQQAGQAGTFATLLGGLQGTVDKVDGKTLTVTVTRGQQTQTVKVTVGDDTSVQTLSPAASKDVKAGSRIVVGIERSQGQPGQAAQIPTEINARSIVILPGSTGQ